MNPQELAKALRQARKNAGLTQRQAAERMGSHLSFVQRIENGQGDRQVSHLFRYAEAIGARIGFYIEN